MVSERCQHGDEAVASVCQRKNAEFIEDVLSVRDGGKKPVEISLADTLREEGDGAKEVAGAGAKLAEGR